MGNLLEAFCIPMQHCIADYASSLTRTAAKRYCVGHDHVYAVDNQLGNRKGEVHPAMESLHGFVGIGTWETTAEFRNIRIITNGKMIAAVAPGNALADCQIARGDWDITPNLIRQTSTATDTALVFGDAAWHDYDFFVDARKVSGNEGFLIYFATADMAAPSRWVIGGWTNVRHALQSPGIPADAKPGKIETGRWYKIHIRLRGNTVTASIDGKVIHKETRRPADTRFPAALIPDLFADPAIAHFNGRYYSYGTTDGAGQGLSTSGVPVVWTSDDFRSWTLHGPIVDPDFDAKWWAPSSVIYRNGRYYIFPTLDNRITTLVADTPLGPFRTPDNRRITKTSGWKQMDIKVGNPIDAELYEHTDGTLWMAWSQRYICRLSDDLTQLKGTPIEIPTGQKGYSEGPILFARKGMLYYLYTLDGSERYHYAYMVSPSGSPEGPWVKPARDIIAETDVKAGIIGPGHGCVINHPGTDKWSFVHLEFGRSGTNRQSVTQDLTFDPDGWIVPIKLNRNHEPLSKKMSFGVTASSTARPLEIPPVNRPELRRVEEFSASNILDGSNGTRWMAASSDTSPNVVVDIRQIRSVTTLEIAFVNPTGGHSFAIDVATTPGKWREIADVKTPVIASPHRIPVNANARFIRCRITSGTPGIWSLVVGLR